MRLYNAFKHSMNPSNGTPGNLISLPWLKKYMTFIDFETLSRNLTPQNLKIDDHPSPISNADFVETDR